MNDDPRIDPRMPNPGWHPAPTPPVRPEIPIRLEIALSIDDKKSDRVIELLSDILTRIKRLEGQSVRLERQGVREMATIAEVLARTNALRASVESETSVVTSMSLVMDGNTETLRAVKQQLAEAIAAGGSDPTALQQVVDAIDQITATNETNKQATIAAVLKNTPAADLEPEEPPVDPMQAGATDARGRPAKR